MANYFNLECKHDLNRSKPAPIGLEEYLVAGNTGK
jgi:hypothetical protein